MGNQVRTFIDFISNNPAILISILALLFTVFSFWWMNWRKGKLIIGIPRSYAAFGSKEGRAVMEFPFIFFNNGHNPIFIQNIRIIITNEEDEHPFIFTATVEKLGTDQGRSLATQFPVKGRESKFIIAEFQREPGRILFQKGIYPIELQALIGNNPRWRRISRFSMNVSSRSASSINSQFIAHDNMQD